MKKWDKISGIPQKSINIIDNLTNYSRMEMRDVFASLGTGEQGLSNEEANRRLGQYGLNQVAHEKPAPWYQQLVAAFINPFIIVLVVLALVSLFMDVLLASPDEQSWEAVVVIAVMVTVSGLLRFFQEYRSSLEAERLKEMVITTATVLRRGKGQEELLMAEIVPGDIIQLAAGDMIPADVRVITSKDLFISQSALTGEAIPVEKYSRPPSWDAKPSLTDLENICFLGTNVISGSATAVVLATGNDTYFGSMAQSLAGKRAQTSFDKGVNSVSWLLIRFMLIMVPIVFIINGLTKGDWLAALLFGLSVAVGLTPEMLPMIVTTNLAKGAIVMAKHKTVVKQLNAIQNFGAMDILCTDKTGTLTLDKIVLERHLDIHGKEDDRVLRHAYLNSFFQTGLKNLIDVAILEFGAEKGFKNMEDHYRKVDEIPFDFNRRRMSVVLEDKDQKRQLVTNGAVEEMLDICSMAEYQGQVVPLTQAVKEEVLAMVTKLNEEGMRVLVIAQKNDIPYDKEFGVADEKNMVLMGYIAFLDPPKESAPVAIRALESHGVNVKVLTGDNEVVTKKICGEVGLSAHNILLGSQIDELDDEQLAIAAENATVFAKLSPLQKSRIIQVLQNNGHIVGFLGDGINDAAALKVADVGISVDTAVDIAKESADIILLEKSLTVLEEGVIEGRRIFGNIIKYIKMTASSNFGNVFSVLVASAFLPFLPMLPIHLLIQNLLYDISQIAIPWDTMDEEYLKQPRQWNADDIGRFMLYIGPISSIFDIIAFAVMWYVFGANTVSQQSLFQSGWFVVGLLTQTLIVHMLRTEKIPFIQSRATLPVLLTTGAIMAIGVAVPFSAFGASVGLVSLPGNYFVWLVGILLGYCLLTQLVKTWYINRFAQWL